MSLYDDNTTNYEDKNPKKEAKDDLIDIHSLNSARDYRFNKQIEIYDTFLKRCLQRIKSVTRDRPFCIYSVPLFSMGVPRFDRFKCSYYIYHKLQHLGFKVNMRPDLKLYIAWSHITSYVKDPELKNKIEKEKDTKEVEVEVKKYRDIQDSYSMINNNFIYNMNNIRNKMDTIQKRAASKKKR